MSRSSIISGTRCVNRILPVNRQRFTEITARYPTLRVAVVGDFCLDRYLEIDPSKFETSIETGLPVHNVVNVRSQPGGAGTILSNLVALGVSQVTPIGFVGADGEGFELRAALRERTGVDSTLLISTSQRRTFTYCKPLLVTPGKAPVELNRLDSKNWSPTPAVVESEIVEALNAVSRNTDAVVALDQVDLPDTGVVTTGVLKTLAEICARNPGLTVVGDSRRHLFRFPPMTLKMNRSELGALAGQTASPSLEKIRVPALDLARRHNRAVFVTLSEDGILGAAPTGEIVCVASLPLRGTIDIVGAGDAVTANLTAALASGASMSEAMTMANTAASVVIHQLGTTGTASVRQIAALLFPN